MIAPQSIAIRRTATSPRNRQAASHKSVGHSGANDRGLIKPASRRKWSAALTVRSRSIRPSGVCFHVRDLAVGHRLPAISSVVGFDRSSRYSSEYGTETPEEITP